MFDGRRGTLLGSGRRGVAGAARGGKGFLMRRSSLPGPGGSPRGADQSDGGYHILTNVRWSASTYTHTQSSRLRSPYIIFFPSAGSHSLPPLALLWETAEHSVAFYSAGHSCYLAGDSSHFSLPHHLSDFSARHKCSSPI